MTTIELPEAPLCTPWCEGHNTYSGEVPGVVYKVEDGRLVAEIGGLTVVSATGVINVWPYQGIGCTEQFVLAAGLREAAPQRQRLVVRAERHA